MLPIDTQFDTQFADDLAKLESYNKHLYRPNTYLHKWWARRCGSTFRTILKSLNSDNVAHDYYVAGGLEGKIILDPMMGGGTTLHEAIRMGANVIGADLDPIPVLQARATLTDVPLEELETAFASFFEEIKSSLEPFYRTHCPHCETAVPLQYTLYGWKQKCDCGEALFIDSTILRHNSDDTIISIDPANYAILEDGKVLFTPKNIPSIPLRTRDIKECATCTKPYQENKDIPYYQRYEPIAIVGQCKTHGLFFAPPQSHDLAAITRADEERTQCGFDRDDFPVAHGAKSKSLHVRGIENYLDLFSSRQLLYLKAAMAGLAELEPKIRLNLALLLSTSLEFNTMLCGYKGDKKRRPGAIRHAFAYHAYSFPYTALENNPIYPTRASGALNNLFYGRIIRGCNWAAAPVERKVENGRAEKTIITNEVDKGIEVKTFADLQGGESKFLLIQGSSANLDLPDDSVDTIVTDPPYFDSVQYSDLASFFHVWLRQMLPNGADWQYAQTGSAVEAEVDGDGESYTEILSGIFRECARVLKDDGRFIFTYHHWNPKGWAALTYALKQAGFILISRYVVHAENLISRHIVGQNALKHDVILVCAPVGQANIREWKPLSNIRTDSQEFCEDCGTTIGWLLTSEYSSENAISTYWQTLFNNLSDEQDSGVE